MRESTGLGMALAAVLLACGGGVKHEPDTPQNAPHGSGYAVTAPVAHTAAAPAAAPRATEQPAAASANDAPEISRSAGTAGGVVVLWPRIVQPRGAPPPDASLRALAGRVQSELARIAKDSGAAVDLRPEPERVCPRVGCQATRLGALVTRADHGCAVVAVVGRPGTSPARLVPWAGSVKLSASEVPFRSPPERVVHVEDYVPCDAVDLSKRAADVTAALRAAR